ncbi:MAG: ExbD/TolR family protein [Thermoanaerobaculia bacterium]
MIAQSLGNFGVVMFGVVLTVFVIFFAATPIVCGVAPRVELPFANTAEQIIGAETDLDVTIKRDAILVGRRYVTSFELEAELRKLAEFQRDRRILIRADRSVSYAAVERTLRAARAAGFEQFSLITDSHSQPVQ